jgi:CYTH domain-containing protein
VLAEIELERVDEKVRLPKWIGEDVTDDPRYRNSSLADTG